MSGDLILAGLSKAKPMYDGSSVVARAMDSEAGEMPALVHMPEDAAKYDPRRSEVITWLMTQPNCYLAATNWLLTALRRRGVIVFDRDARRWSGAGRGAVEQMRLIRIGASKMARMAQRKVELPEFLAKWQELQIANPTMKTSGLVKLIAAKMEIATRTVYLMRRRAAAEQGLNVHGYIKPLPEVRKAPQPQAELPELPELPEKPRVRTGQWPKKGEAPVDESACEACSGTGLDPSRPDGTCEACQGSGLAPVGVNPAEAVAAVIRADEAAATLSQPPSYPENPPSAGADESQTGGVAGMPRKRRLRPNPVAAAVPVAEAPKEVDSVPADEEAFEL